MARPLVSVLIPTTGRRATMLARVRQAFLDVAEADRYTVEILTVAGYSWGEGLNQLATAAKGDYWLGICDDTLPWAGWFSAARQFVDRRLTPVPRYLTENGTPLHAVDATLHMQPVAWCRSFLLTPALYAEVGPFLDTTWWADVDYSERMREAGYELLACDGFAFTHLGGERDWLTRAEEDRQRKVYEAAQRARGIEPVR